MNSGLILMTMNETAFFARLGKRMAELRKQQGYTQVQLAEILNIKQYVVASYETGRRRPSVAFMPEIAKALGVSVEDLLSQDRKSGKRGPTPKLQQQIEQLQRLPKGKQKFVSEFIETVIQQATH